ncbi:hydroxymethylbilane synthase [Streptoalloteichus hindustanus]|uniref:Porphobilinogen deaminase n=1 Tax=Streptoalloteichus hindustanus TaxID=2017 RepID=A0A1M5NAU0_STRHI|nr:hydroxymethylbilane synthase [Streptoalloteichus hindustanus]SHG86608.1 hydroxymethylbilane synthase [Streptoalloteichus hindustanus]
MTTTMIQAQAVSDRVADGPLRIGTRTTPLALAQTRRVVDAIQARVPGLPVELVKIRTTADLWSGDLARIGGKSNFTKEIDHALVRGQVDLAVHSLKDVPGDVPLPAGTALAAYLERGDVHDVVVTRDGRPLADLPAGAKVGSSSVRRRAQIGLFRPDLVVERVRGGVDRRLEKLDAGEYDALLLARAGLERLGLADRVTEVLPTVWSDGATPAIVPAVGAAIIAVQVRTADAVITELAESFSHEPTAICATAERALLHALRGHCNSPIAGHCHITPDRQLSLVGMVFSRDGSQWVHAHRWGALDDPASLGVAVAGDLLHQGARRLIEATRK